MKHVFKRVPLSQFTNTMSVQDNLRVGKKTIEPIRRLLQSARLRVVCVPLVVCMNALHW